MADFPALPLWTDAYLADCSHLTDAEHGRYFLLLMTIWRAPDCRLPNDNDWLARKFRRTTEEIASMFRPLIEEFCTCDGNWISQKRLMRERLHVTKSSKRQSVRAKSRWNKEKEISHGNAGVALPPQPQPQPQPQHPYKSAAAPRFEPPDWIPAEAWKAFEEMRQRIRKPMTNTARGLIVRDLEGLKKSGCDPGEVLLQSVKNSWQGVFAPKDRTDGHAGKNSGQHGLTKTERAKAAVLRAAVAGGYAPEQPRGPAGSGDDNLSVFPIAQALRQGT